MVLETAMLQNILNVALQPPNNILTYGLLTATLILIYDIQTGISFKLPAGRQIGLAALIAILSSGYYYLQRFGFQSFYDKTAEFMFFSVFLGAVAVFYFRNKK